MDCGDVKASLGPYTLEYIAFQINHKYNFNGSAGTLTFQVMVDEKGFSCVLSHTDPTNSQLTWDIIRLLNGSYWRPAILNGKRVSASVNVVFNIANGKVSAQMKRMDPRDLAELKPADAPIIYNKQYTYKNPTLDKYDLSVFTKFNSALPDNVGETCVVDKEGILWYATANGFARFDNDNFIPVNETNSPFTSSTVISAIGVDKDDTKWISANKLVYTFSSKGWRLFDSTNFKIAGASRIITNPSGDVFFTNNKGLLIIRGDKLVLMDQKVFPGLPSNDVNYAYFDTQERLWIGTGSGSVMIDKKQKTTTYNNTTTPLSNVNITNMVEDENGNLYFALRAYNNSYDDIDEEGIVELTADGQWKHYNDKNSGLPSNRVNSLLYDKIDHVLWIGTKNSGLARFDLKNGWENYNNANSAVPGHDINQLAEDSKGTIYAATTNGMLRISKK